jgi:hypothetical protein
MEGQREIELTDLESGPISSLGAQIDALIQQRNGMVMYLANLKGVSNSGIDVRGNKLIITPRPNLKETK